MGTTACSWVIFKTFTLGGPIDGMTDRRIQGRAQPGLKQVKRGQIWGLCYAKKHQDSMSDKPKFQGEEGTKLGPGFQCNCEGEEAQEEYQNSEAEGRELGRMRLRYQVCISHLEVVTFWQKDEAAQQAWNKRNVCIKDTLRY